MKFITIFFAIFALASFALVHATSLPKSFNWIDRGFDLPVPAGTECGSSQLADIISYQISGAAFAQNKTQKPVLLSAAQLVDCDIYYGCEGGFVDGTIQSLITNSAGYIATNESYPWTANLNQGNPDPCQTQGWKIGAKVTGYRNLPNDEKAIQEYIYTHGVVTSPVDSNSWGCGGVKHVFGSACSHTQSYDQVLLIVGWHERTVTIPETNETKSLPFWIGMNAFGTEWGNNGFIDLEMFVNCSGIAYQTLAIDVEF